MGANRGTFVKICGITQMDDARAAVRAGANAIGFVFAESPRMVSSTIAAVIGSGLHPSVRKFGVFVNEETDNIVAMARECGLDGVQLQGDESPEQVAEVKKALPSQFVAKVVRVTGPDEVAKASLFQHADAIFFDSKDVAHPEDASIPIPLDWLLATEGKVVISGGLTPQSVTEVVRRVRPWGVDVSTGVESRPGIKDKDKMKAFIAAVRAADARSG